MKKVEKPKKRFVFVDPIKNKENKGKEIFISGNLNTSIFEFLAEIGIALRRNIQNKLKVELPTFKRVEDKRVEKKSVGNKSVGNDTLDDEVKEEVVAIKKLLTKGDKLSLVSELKEREIDDLIKTKVLIEKLGDFDNPLAREIEKKLLDPNISSSQLKKLLKDTDVSKEEDIEIVSIVSLYLSGENTSNKKNKIEDGLTSGLLSKLQNALSSNADGDNGLKIERHRDRRENRR